MLIARCEFVDLARKAHTVRAGSCCQPHMEQNHGWGALAHGHVNDHLLLIAHVPICWMKSADGTQRPLPQQCACACAALWCACIAPCPHSPHSPLRCRLQSAPSHPEAMRGQKRLSAGKPLRWQSVIVFYVMACGARFRRTGFQQPKYLCLKH